MVKKTCMTYSRTAYTRILKDFIRQQTYRGESHDNVRSMGGGRGPTLCNFRHSKYSACVRKAPMHDRSDTVGYMMS